MVPKQISEKHAKMSNAFPKKISTIRHTKKTNLGIEKTGYDINKMDCKTM